MSNQDRTMMDRRGFLKLTGAGVGGLLLHPLEPAMASAPTGDDVAILYDVSKCIGCRTCERACKEYNDLPDPLAPNTELSATAWNLIEKREDVEVADWPFFNAQCQHCTDAACVTACPSKALFKDEMGFVAYDRNRCIGCGYCTQFCPFGVPQLGEVNLLTGAAKMSKCTFCQDKTTTGTGGPSCVEACPTGALTWGKRETLLNEAKVRVAELKTEGHSTATLYGEIEAGGLHRLSILLDDPAAYGLPTNIQGPITLAGIYRKIIQPVGLAVFGVTLAGVSAAYVLSRRNIHMEEVE